MAASAISRVIVDTPVAESYQLFEVNLDTDTSIVITPTNIKSITEVNVTPANATAGAATWYITQTYGAASFTITSVNNATFKVTVRGTQA